MGKFVIECPKCGSINEGSYFLFAKKIIQCGTCHEEINIKASRLVSKICPHCGKTFVCDQRKSRNRECPACGEKIDLWNTQNGFYRFVTIDCPQCTCSIEIDKTKDWTSCPICDHEIDVQKEIAKQGLVTDSEASIIQYEGDNSTFVWKHPVEDFNANSQLIVHESQEAIFMLNGKIIDVFGAGLYTLNDEALHSLKTDGDKISAGTCHAEVYFINKTVQMGIKWGTPSRVHFIEPKTGIPLDIGAAGELNIQVENSRKLLTKLVGTTDGLTNKQILSAETIGDEGIHKTLQSYFRAPIITTVKTYLASVIRENEINIFEIDAQMDLFSKALRDKLSPVLEEYGLSIPQFYVTNLSLPEDDPNYRGIKSLITDAYMGVRSEEIKTDVTQAQLKRQLAEEETKAQIAAIRARGEAEAKKALGLAEAEVMHAQGYSQKDLIDAEVQKAYAESMSKANATQSPVWACSCGETRNVGKFCMNCGAPRVWNCECGATNNTGNFCSECGRKKA